jgi:hypothetical protein
MVLQHRSQAWLGGWGLKPLQVQANVAYIEKKQTNAKISA